MPETESRGDPHVEKTIPRPIILQIVAILLGAIVAGLIFSLGPYRTTK